MRLGSSILGGKPMRIPGIVDVYQVGDEWVARSWPKVQNQPNSAAQLLWRKKFTDAKAIIHTFPPFYKRLWQAIECPPGKMWIDIALHCLLVAPGQFSQIPQGDQMKFVLYYSQTIPDGWMSQYCVWQNFNARMFLATGPGYNYFNGSKWADIMKWNDMGWICPNGKRPKKRWQLVYRGTTPDYVGTDSLYFGVWPNGQWVYRNFYANCPTGITWAKLNYWSAGADYEADYALQMPPLYFPVHTWPGSFTP